MGLLASFAGSKAIAASKLKDYSSVSIWHNKTYCFVIKKCIFILMGRKREMEVVTRTVP